MAPTNRIFIFTVAMAFSLFIATSHLPRAQVVSGPGQGILIDNMQSGWSSVFTKGTVSINRTSFVEGTGSTELSIAPSNQNGFAGAILKNENINLNNATNFYFWVYIQNASKLIGNGNWGVTLDFSNDQNYNNYFQCGITSLGLESGWDPIVIARSECESIGNPSWAKNMTSIEFNVALATKNSTIKYPTNFVTNFDDLRYNYGGGVFGKAQVILTFDGSWNSTLINATPIMQANHQSGVAFIVTNQINELGTNMGGLGDCGVGRCINITQITKLYKDGWDISSHTVNHANLVARTSDDYPTGINDAYELAKSYSTLSSDGFGSGAQRNSAQFFAYPNGAYNQSVISLIKSQGNYIFARALGSGVTQPNLLPGDPYNISLRAQSLPLTPSVTAIDVENAIDQVIQEKGLLILTFHIIQPNPQGDPNESVEYSTQNFTLISNYLRQKQNQGLLQVTNLTSYYVTMSGVIITTTTSTSTTSTISSSTTTIPSSCSSTPILALTPNPSAISGAINAHVSGLSGCSGFTITISDYLGCTSGATIASTSSGANSASLSFQAPSASGQYGYFACINGQSSAKGILTVN